VGRVTSTEGFLVASSNDDGSSSSVHNAVFISKPLTEVTNSVEFWESQPTWAATE